MPSAKAIKARNRKYYKRNAESITSQSREKYSTNPEPKKESAREKYRTNPEPKKESAREKYTINPEPKKESAREKYTINPEPKKESAREKYTINPEPKKESAREKYSTNPEPKMEASHEQYSTHSETIKEAAHEQYSKHPEKKRASSRRHYSTNREEKRTYSRKQYRGNPSKKKAAAHAYRALNRYNICAQKRAKYVLAEPKPDVKHMYVKEIQSQLLADAEARSQISDIFPKMHINAPQKVSATAMCRVAAKKLLNKALQIRREHAGSLLQAARLVQSMELTDKNDFGEGCHMASTEPFFYDSAYKLVKRECALPIDTNGRCVIAKKVVCTFGDIPRYSAKEPPMKWECSSECKIITDAEVCTIIDLAAAFQKPMRELRCALESVDSGCPNQHYTKYVVDTLHHTVHLKGHPLVCSNGGGCHSKLRIIRSAATHYPVLVTLSHHVYRALCAHVGVQKIDKALGSGDFHTLMEITKIGDFATLLSNEIDTSYEQCTEASDSVLTHAGVENNLLIEHAELITQFEREVDDYPEHVCCSCECLYQRKSVTKVKLSDKLGNAVWPRLKEFILGKCPNTTEVGTMYMCNYCKASVKNNKLPPRCALNGLEPVPIPVELEKLDALSAQLIQLAKCYQTVVRLGTYYLH